MTRARRTVSIVQGVTALAGTLLASSAWPQATAPDPIFEGDFVDPALGEVVELQPQAPWTWGLLIPLCPMQVLPPLGIFRLTKHSGSG